MILASVTIVAAPGQHEELKRALRALVGPVRVEPGCLSCQLLQDVEQPDALTLAEEWATPADVERRLRSNEYRLLLQLMESSPQPPKVAFHIVERTEGLDCVQRARLLVDSASNNFRDLWKPQSA